MSLSTIFDGITALAAVAVAVIANRYAKRQTTIQITQSLENRMADLDDRYIALGDFPVVIDAEAIARVDSNLLAQSLIQQRLNALESFALCVVEHIVDPRIARRLMRQFVLDEHRNLKYYIAHIRNSEESPNAWSDFENLAKSWSSA